MWWCSLRTGHNANNWAVLHLHKLYLCNPEAVFQRYCVKKVFLEILQKSHKNTCVKQRCFSVNFAKFLRTPSLTKYLRWLILVIFYSFCWGSHLDSVFQVSRLFRYLYLDGEVWFDQFWLSQCTFFQILFSEVYGLSLH